MNAPTPSRARALWQAFHIGLRRGIGALPSQFAPRRLFKLLRRFRQVSTLCRGAAVSVVVVGAILAILGSVLWEMTRRTVTIEPIIVPSQLAERGYTPHVTSQRLLAEINEIKDKGQTHMDTLDTDYRLALSGLPSTPDFVVPTFSMSIRATAAYLLRVFGREHPVVTGEFIYQDSDNSALSLSVRVNDLSVARFEGQTADNLLRRAAAEVVRATEPYVLAVYFYQSDDKMQAEAILSDLLASAWTESAFWALNLQGIMLDERERYDEAMKKYNRARSLEPEEPFVYHNMGNVLFAQHEYRAAISMYEQALDYDAEFAELSYFILGRAYAEIKEYETAIEKYQRVCELAPRLCEDMEVRIAILKRERGS